MMKMVCEMSEVEFKQQQDERSNFNQDQFNFNDMVEPID
jgi:hypothetical protein